jgi:uncharacterized protein YcbX
MPTLDRITIYPVKSLDGLDVEEARVLPTGALENDRRWRLVDMEGRVMNAKRSPLFHAIRAEFALGPAVDSREGERLVTLWVDPAAIAAGQLPDIARLRHLPRESFHLVPGPDGPCDWLSEAFGERVLLEERADGGFPDDRDSPGPTLISTATLVEVARWFGFDVTECRRRFRVNLEIGGCDAFWEDTLASPAELPFHPDTRCPSLVDPYADPSPPQPRTFRLGDAAFMATNVCNRCVVPSRDSTTGAMNVCFRDAFEAWRRQRGREDVDSRDWRHFYKLAVNTMHKDAELLRTGSTLMLG